MGTVQATDLLSFLWNSHMDIKEGNAKVFPTCGRTGIGGKSEVEERSCSVEVLY